MFAGKTQKSGADFTFLPSILDNIARNIMAELQKFFPLIDKSSSVFFSGPVKLFISLISRVLNCKNSPRASWHHAQNWVLLSALEDTPLSSRRAARQSARACESPGNT